MSLTFDYFLLLVIFPDLVHRSIDLILCILGQRISNNVSVKAAGEEISTETPEIVKKLQDTVRFISQFCFCVYF